MTDPTILEKYFDRLWPLNRSLTGNGNRESIRILSEILPLTVSEVPSGTKCFDWTVPPEWNVREAWIKDPSGKTIVDFKKNNLHLLGYSVPFSGKLSLAELKNHLYSLPDQPDLIPYLTSYYKERWGFCISHTQLKSLGEGMYQVLIDAELNPQGSMTIADCLLPGASKKEVLFSTYICHPSLANNELSGPLVTAFIYAALKTKKLKYSYRFVFVPETIGSICYLSKYGKDLKQNILAGFVVTTVGDGGNFTYKKSRQKNSLADRAALLLLEQTEAQFKVEEFNPADGSDERQYCSPGFDFPIGSLMRTMYGVYPEYHTSADNKQLMNFEAMSKVVSKYVELVEMIEANETYENLMPFGEPQLGKRGLYPTLGSQKEVAAEVVAIMWLLNLSDGRHDLIEISRESGVKFKALVDVAKKLYDAKLISAKSS